MAFFFRDAVVGSGPQAAVFGVRAGVLAVKLIFGGRAELWRCSFWFVVVLGVPPVAVFWAGPWRFCSWSAWGEGAGELLVVGLW